jgi:microcystin-dependent protein
MSGFLVPLDLQQFDDDGVPLALGLLYFFAAGTSTPLAVYTAADLLTPTANPLQLDGAGRWTAFVASGIGYDVQAKTAAGVLVRAWSSVSVPAVPAVPATVAVPTGAVIAFGGTAAPTGYQLCDGSAISRATFAALFAILGTAYGVGNGSTTFNVPDFRQRFLLGKAVAGTGATLGETGGTIDHVHTGPSHSHTSPAHSHSIAHTHSVPFNAWTTNAGGAPVAGVLQAGGTGAGSEATVSQATANNTTGASSAANSGSTALTTDAGGTGNTGSANPPYQTVNWIVKT